MANTDLARLLKAEEIRKVLRAPRYNIVFIISLIINIYIPFILYDENFLSTGLWYTCILWLPVDIWCIISFQHLLHGHVAEYELIVVCLVNRKNIVRRVRRLNPLVNARAMLRLNPYAAVLKRQAILANEKRKNERDIVLAKRRGVSCCFVLICIFR